MSTSTPPGGPPPGSGSSTPPPNTAPKSGAGATAGATLDSLLETAKKAALQVREVVATAARDNKGRIDAASTRSANRSTPRPAASTTHTSRR